MLKLRFSKPSVKTYKDGKITVCKYDCTLIDGETKIVVNEFSTTGMSKCSPNDALDVDYGRKLADSRAKLAAYKIASSIITEDEIQQMLAQMEHFSELIHFTDTMRYLKKKEISHIEFLNTEKYE